MPPAPQKAGGNFFDGTVEETLRPKLDRWVGLDF